MALYIATEEQIEEYFNSPDLGQSTLKGLLQGFDAFMNKREFDDKEKKSLIIGSAVDTILTGNKDSINKKYYVSVIDSKPSDKEMEIIKIIFNTFENLLEEGNIDSIEENLNNIDPEVILMAIDIVEWQKNWKADTRISKIREVGSEYYRDLCKSRGKQVLSISENNLILDIVGSLENNPLTKDYFNREFFKNDPYIDMYYQLPIYFEVEGIKRKALLDMLIVQRSEDGSGIVAYPVDLKTMYGNTLNFMDNVNRFRYDIQAAWYTEAVTHFLLDTYQMPIIIQDFKFIVESTSSVGQPLVYTMTQELLDRGRQGLAKVEFESSGRKITLANQIKGFSDLLEEFKYYQSTSWEKDRILVENEGKPISLGLNGII